MGIRSETIAALDAFLTELSPHPENDWRDWAVSFAKESLEGSEPTPIRVPLFRRAIFPALRAGLLARRPHCARLLAACSQLLYQNRDCLEQLPESLRWAEGLLRDALEVDPADTRARDKLLDSLESGLEYALHELPTGILYGANGSTADQCLELLEMLREFEALAEAAGKTDEHAELIEDARFYIPDYREYLLARAPGDRYANWLEKKGRA